MRSITAAGLAALLLLLVAAGAPVHGQAPEPGRPAPAGPGTGYLPYEEPHPLEHVSVWGALGRSVVALGVVLGLMGGAVILVRRFMPGIASGTGTGPVRVVGRVVLAPKLTIYFLQLPGRILIVGSGGGQLSALGEITDAAEMAEVLQAAPALTAMPGAAFSGLLQRRLEQARAAVPTAASGPEDAALDAIRRQIASLRSLARPERK